MHTYRALLYEPSRGEWLAFGVPREEYRIGDLASLQTTLGRVCDAVETRGFWAVVMLSYESAPAFDPSFTVHPPGSFPLAWCALFDRPTNLKSLPPAAPGDLPRGALWRPSIDAGAYTRAIHTIRELIASGDTYQVNFTFRLRREFPTDPYALFSALAAGEPPPFAAFLDLDSHAICSLSPELFFRLDGDRLVSRPMKGTTPRGLGSDDDLLASDRLRRSPKNRAENIMIVDMVRNDMGRIAHPGTVIVSRRHDIEQYPTVWQMTSTVEARTDASLPAVLTALFPPASITGAPKVRTMGIIRHLEESPRHVYTGALGWVAPGRMSQFSVAIRTLLVDRKREEAEYGVGGGIVWDSSPQEEYQESLTKALVLEYRQEEFSLLETMLWTADGGYPLLDDHLARLRASARYFGFPFDETLIRNRLIEAAGKSGGLARTGVFGQPDVSGPDQETLPSTRKVRLLLQRDGTLTVDTAPAPFGRSKHPLRVQLAVEPVDHRDPFLFHKTTHRLAYDRAREAAGGADDVILWNSRHELTESCIANVIVDLQGSLYTPPVACGLLPGISRGRALRAGTVRERVLRVADLQHARRVFLTNAVRGTYEVQLLT